MGVKRFKRVFIQQFCSEKLKKSLILYRVSLSRPAPAESPRLGTKQG